jgi:hypothetical protein
MQLPSAHTEPCWRMKVYTADELIKFYLCVLTTPEREREIILQIYHNSVSVQFEVNSYYHAIFFSWK